MFTNKNVIYLIYSKVANYCIKNLKIKSVLLNTPMGKLAVVLGFVAQTVVVAVQNHLRNLFVE